jgi:hypothetical protein
MKRLHLGVNFTVFVLFFGVATLEAFESHNWIKAAFWLTIGAAFLAADNLRKRCEERRQSLKNDSVFRD